jgi:hypothetical protein
MSKTTELSAIQRYWLSHIKACEKSGSTIKAYADEQGLPVGSLYNARHQLKAKGLWSSDPTDWVEADCEHPTKPTPAFRRVIVATDTTEAPPIHSSVFPTPATTRCRIHLPNGVMLEVMTGTDAVALASVVEAARAWT